MIKQNLKNKFMNFKNKNQKYHFTGNYWKKNVTVKPGERNVTFAFANDSEQMNKLTTTRIAKSKYEVCINSL